MIALALHLLTSTIGLIRETYLNQSKQTTIGVLQPIKSTGCTFSRAWRWLHVFPRLVPVVRFPALGAGCMFCRPWSCLHVLAPVACFPALGVICMFSHAWRQLHSKFEFGTESLYKTHSLTIGQIPLKFISKVSMP